MSSAEAEMNANQVAAQALVYLKGLLSELGVIVKNSVALKEGKQLRTALSRQALQKNRTKDFVGLFRFFPPALLTKLLFPPP